MLEYRDLVICNNCLWAASLLNDSSSVDFELCPNCGRRGLEIIPVGHYESYKMSIDNKWSIKIEFAEKSNDSKLNPYSANRRMA